MSSSPASSNSPPLAGHRTLRIVIWSVLLVVLALGFVGYLTPGMKLNWETIATMCGF